MDALSETLRVVRLIGAIFINARFTAPWSYQSLVQIRRRRCWSQVPSVW